VPDANAAAGEVEEDFVLVVDFRLEVTLGIVVETDMSLALAIQEVTVWVSPPV
jgi:hypothetical protein